MLVLSRKVGEKICIGDNIVVEVRRISGTRVAIGLEAPNDVLILRGELERFDRSEGGSVESTIAPAPYSASSDLPSPTTEVGSGEW